MFYTLQCRTSKKNDKPCTISNVATGTTGRKKDSIGNFEEPKLSGVPGTTVATRLTKDCTGRSPEKRADASQPGAELEVHTGIYVRRNTTTNASVNAKLLSLFEY
jgi:hypothetical protein